MAGVDRRPTMRDVAALAGVSLKTVSRVVNGEPGVSPSLAAAVSSAVAALSFRPDAAARGLRRSDRRSYCVGLVVDDLASWGSFVASASAAALSAGYVLLVADRGLAAVRAFAAHGIDGLLLVPVAVSGPELAAVLRPETPVLTLAAPVDGAGTMRHLLTLI